MLYDPKWEANKDPFSLAGLIAWLERQDPDRAYCYSSTGECLLARYFRERGFNRVIMAAEFFSPLAAGRRGVRGDAAAAALQRRRQGQGAHLRRRAIARARTGTRRSPLIAFSLPLCAAKRRAGAWPREPLKKPAARGTIEHTKVAARCRRGALRACTRRAWRESFVRDLLAWTGLIFAASGASAEPCVDNPHVLGTERTIVVEPWTLPRVGTFQYPQTLPLGDHEVVLTFDDGPSPEDHGQGVGACRRMRQGEFLCYGGARGAGAGRWCGVRRAKATPSAPTPRPIRI